MLSERKVTAQRIKRLPSNGTAVSIIKTLMIAKQQDQRQSETREERMTVYKEM